MTKNMHAKTKTALGAGVVVVAVLLYLLMQTPATPPKEFLETRIQTIGAVNNLTQLMNNSLANFEKVNTFIGNKNFVEARDFIKFEFSQRAERQNAAVLLATHLEKMAQAATQIDSSGARSDAVEAITSGIAMVSRMVSYSNNLELLFNELQRQTAGGAPNNGMLAKLSGDLNADAAAINELGENFNEAFNRLDRRYGIE